MLHRCNQLTTFFWTYLVWTYFFEQSWIFLLVKRSVFVLLENNIFEVNFLSDFLLLKVEVIGCSANVIYSWKSLLKINRGFLDFHFCVVICLNLYGAECQVKSIFNLVICFENKFLLILLEFGLRK